MTSKSGGNAAEPRGEHGAAAAVAGALEAPDLGVKVSLLGIVDGSDISLGPSERMLTARQVECWACRGAGGSCPETLKSLCNQLPLRRCSAAVVVTSCRCCFDSELCIDVGHSGQRGPADRGSIPYDCEIVSENVH